jgi:Fe-S oxidoreductase
VARLQETGFEDKNSLCCGGSLGNIKISSRQKSMIAHDVAAELTKDNPDILATSCPLCKKTLAAATTTKVADISEIVADAIVKPAIKKKLTEPAGKVEMPADFQN